MITVTFFTEGLAGSKEEGSGLVGFRAIGHAGYADSGSDIVCAGVTAILKTAANGLTEVLGCKAHVHTDTNRGYLRVRLDGAYRKVNDLEVLEKVDTLMKVARLGISGIAEQYPKYVTLDTKAYTDSRT